MNFANKAAKVSLSVLSILGYGYFVFAAGPFAAGTQLDPDCSPYINNDPLQGIDTDCTVTTSGWSLGGNTGTTAGINFIGTTDAQDFVIKTNNIQIATFGQNGNVAIGSANAGYVASAPVASGENSFAFLAGIASGDYSISAGISGTEASGVASIAFGQANTASGVGSIVLGGDSNIASGLQSFAMQQGNTASGLDSTAFGAGTTASGTLAVAFGDSTTASGVSATAFGLFAIASGSNSTAFGATTFARSYGETAFGVQNTDYTPTSATVFDSSDRLLSVGNGNGSPSDAFTILKNGKTGIGYDNFETTSSAALLQVNGDILQTGASSCSLVADADGVIACAPSDQNLKQDITNIDSGLSIINELRPVTYTFKDEKYGSGIQVGFIAQELETILPEVVTNGPEYKSVNYGLITPLLTKAIQELDLKISSMESIAGGMNQSQIAEWLGTITNGIAQIFAEKIQTNELCVGDRCMTEDQFNKVFDLIDQSEIQTPEPDLTPTLDSVPSDPEPQPEPTPDINVI